VGRRGNDHVDPRVLLVLGVKLHIGANPLSCRGRRSRIPVVAGILSSRRHRGAGRVDHVAEAVVHVQEPSMSRAAVRHETEVPQIFDLLGGVEAAIVSSPLGFALISAMLRSAR
jgi:hypothetical protein